jgi:hypothetical protein
MGRGGAASFVGADIAEGSGETDGWWTKWVSKYLKGVPAPMREDRPMIKSNYLHLMAWGLPFPVYGKYSARVTDLSRPLSQIYASTRFNYRFTV